MAHASAPQPMTTRRLVAFRLRALSRRLARHPALLLGGLLAVGAALAGLGLGAWSFAAADTNELAVRDRTFWLTTLTALIYSYTSFEVLFRAKDQRFIATLPLPGQIRFDDLFLRALALHLPLLLPGLAYAAAHLAQGAPDAALYAALVSLVQFAIGLPLSTLLHLFAGRSLLSKSSDLKRLLAGAVVENEAALLVYAPALGLLATLVLGIFTDLMLRDAILRHKAAMLAPVLLGAAAIAALSFRAARHIARDALHLILPRFSEVDVPPPYREDGIRKIVPGEGLVRLLPPTAHTYFLRDLRQLRRRYRLDRILLWLFPLVALKVVHDAPEAASSMRVAGAALVALALMNGLFIVSAFRLRGELASPSLDLTLPRNLAAERLGRLAASSLYPLAATGLAALATATTGDLVAAALVAALGLALTVALVLGSHAVATLSATRPTLGATLWRLAIAALASGAGGLV